MNVFIRHYKDNYHWFVSSPPQETQVFQGSLEELAAFYRGHADVKSWVLIAPALDTAQRVIHFTEKERKHISKAIPFILEDDLLTEAPDLYYVADKPVANAVNVVVLDKAILSTWLQNLAAVGIHPTHCLPEVKLLLEPVDGWQIFYREQAFILRSSDGQCTAFEQEHLALITELLTENYATLPVRIELVADDEHALQEAWATMPAILQPLVEARALPYGDMLQDRFTRQAKVWNLLKGSFAYAQEWLGMLLPWRWVALSFVLLTLLHVTMVIIDYRHLSADNKRALAEMEAVFREAIPKGQIVDHRKQLARELEILQRGGGSGHFAQTLQKVGTVFANHQVQTMNSINYEQQKNEIRIDVIVVNYDKLQQVINDLQQAGLTTDIQNSNAQGEELRARIRITG